MPTTRVSSLLLGVVILSWAACQAKQEGREECPDCDPSVYSYCGNKLFHDYCCCTDPYDQPYECRHADCSFLHANSCYEHELIAVCCCGRTVLV